VLVVLEGKNAVQRLVSFFPLFFSVFFFNLLKISFRPDMACERCKRLKKRCVQTEDESKRTGKKRERADSAETETVVKKGKQRKIEVNHEAEWMELAEWRERMDKEWTELTEWREQMDRKIADMSLELVIRHQTMVTAIMDVLRRVVGMEKSMAEMQKKVTEFCEEKDTPPATPREDGDEEMVE
jgi:hypothetical protein